MNTVYHEFGPLFDKNSSILILGSMPSVRSRKEGFYYMHPQNRFWKVMSVLFDEPFPTGIEQRKQLALNHGVALWDILASCRISGSSDASIQHAETNDIAGLLRKTNIQRIYTNGKTAERYFQSYQADHPLPGSVCLPSTSSANAQWPLPRLLKAWSVLLSP